MTLSTFPTFLTFLTQKLCFPAAANSHSQFLESPPYRRERLRPPTVRPEGNDLTRRSDCASEVTMAPRQRLPDRRGHEVLNFEHGGIRYTVGVGRFEDGRLAEIFLGTAKHGTAIDVSARDAGVAASLLLQHGCQVDTLRRALTRNNDGSASGPLARALDLFAEGS